MSELSVLETERYLRHLTLPGFGEAAQLRLKSASVLVVGAGGLGCPVLQYLSAAGVGRIGIVDDDVVSRSNLQRQILYTEADLGASKAESAAARLRAMNPDIRCEVHAMRLDADNAEALCRDYDLVVDGTDNFATRYVVNDACVLTGRPMVYGAVQGFQGQVSVFNFQGGPTYRCLYPEAPAPGDAPNCAELGVLGVLPGLIGLMQATEAIKVLTGIGQPLSGVLLLWNALTQRQRYLRLERDPAAAAVRELRDIPAICQTRPPRDLSDECSPLELRDAQASLGPAHQLIDVREPWERRMCTLDSVHIPLGVLLSAAFDPQQYNLRPDLHTTVYCKAGIRSLQAVRQLRALHGFSNVRSLAGGILNWAAAVDPGLPTY